MGSPPVKGFGQSDPALSAWAAAVYRPEDAVLREIRERCAAEGLPSVQVGAFDGLHLEVLARAAGARRAVEIGTLGGYSGVCLLRGMGPEGRLDTFELDPRRAEVARRSFERAGLAAQARLHVGPAAEAHLRVGGLLLADNAFGFGHVHRPAGAGGDRAAAEALARFSERLARGGRFRATMIPTAEGLSLGVKVR